MRFSTIVFLLKALTGVAAASIVHVDNAAPGGDGGQRDGESWTTAYADLQDALEAAAPGDEIHVADGTYYPDRWTNDPDQAFVLLAGVTIEGGYAGYGSPAPNERDTVAHPTILSGEIGDPYANADNSHHVVLCANLGSDTVLDGVTITAGYAGPSPSGAGGGLCLTQASITVRDCTFVGNRAESGAAVDASGGAPTLIDCTFADNDAEFSGGAIRLSTCDAVISGCWFIGNYAANQGGAIESRHSAPLIETCAFIENSTQFFGGAMNVYSGQPELRYCELLDNMVLTSGMSEAGGGALASDYATVTLVSCLLADNSSVDDGGAIRCTRGDIMLVNVRLMNNQAADVGGAICLGTNTLTLANCQLVANTAFNAGGAIWTTGTLSVWDSTLYANESRLTGGAGGIHVGSGTTKIGNSILWANATPTGTGQSAQVDVTGGDPPLIDYSCVQGWTGDLGGVGNIGLNPLFRDANGADNIIGTEDDDLGLALG
ncbi:MAG: DUF1565 domain-containing protein, partial [Phycisphaerae bacterium]|nr:DUF1565 domain-containing protein [Phycisphaerae bacterium]